MTEPPRKSHPLEFPKKTDKAPPPSQADDADVAAAQPGEVKQATAGEVREFITPLKSFEQQVGEHVMRALATEDTVAVITAVVVGGDGQQRIVSAALDPAMMAQVQQMLGEAARQREEDVPCLGFHCFIDRKDDEPEDQQRTTPADE